jgi:hypothetical protein
MSNRELEIWAWSCLAFGWVFELAGTYLGDPNVYWVAVILFGVAALALFAVFIAQASGGGPLKPA